MESLHAQDEAAHSIEILRQASSFLEQVKMNYENKPEVYKELLRLLKSYSAGRDEAHQHISAQVKALFRGTALRLPQVRNVLIKTIRRGEGTPYAAALVNSAINRVAKVTVGSTAAEDSEEDRIEENAMKTMSAAKNLPGFSVDAGLLEGFRQLLPANVYPTVAGRTMATGGASRFHKEEGRRYMEFLKIYFSDRPDVYERYDVAIEDFERTRIRANRRLYVKARILLQDSPKLFEGFQNFMPENGKGELYRTSAGKLRWWHYHADHVTYEK
ncbi:hypothetical protein VC83_02822 [Pseudogymnoascus destructans]|uniref:Uncharacterized protein n=2 Tax=Pseudogymnoascus destructans TaxID=655981 RepID=L8FWM2_PSED2|nr:uncharacterized protein VC83_02822 [Pseudogymnoascus destructans]ELR04934.1 hypothetical protein GMDG_00192 [Pseudogymnoascus destructans 20631-21]OAF60293.2 hypothetical protein VC83_02822 [Pseudogymnoascus destructans]